MIQLTPLSAENTIRRFAKINTAVESQFKVFLTDEAKLLETKIKAEIERVGAVDVGRLKGSIHGEQYGLTQLVRANADYASVVELGRRPGTFPNLGAIREWVHHKNIAGTRGKKHSGEYGVYNIKTRKQSSADAALDSAAFMIALTIKRRGIKARPFFYPTWINYKGTFNQHMIQLFHRIINER